MRKVPLKLSRSLDSGFAFFEENKDRLLLIALCIMGAVGGFLVLWGTAPYGIGISSDSVEYIWSARNLARGIGLGTLDARGNFAPLTVEPPLYPALLSIFELLGIDAMEGARWIGALAIAGLLIAFGLILARITNRSFWFSFFGTFVLLFLGTTWATALYAMSEPVYLMVTLLGILSLDNYLADRRRRWLVLASILFGIAFLDRYVGISLIAAGGLVLLLQRRVDPKRKILDVLLMGALAGLPMLAWILRNMLLAKTATSYDVGFIPISTREWSLLGDTVRVWILPILKFRFTPIKLFILLMPIPVAYLFLRKGRRPTQTKTQLPILLAVYALLCTLFVLASRWIAYPLVTFYQDRILFPILVGIFCLVVYGLYLFQQVVRDRSIILAAFISGILILLAWSLSLGSSRSYPSGISLVLASRSAGLGLQYQTDRSTDFKNQIAIFKGDSLFFTDDTQRMYFYTGAASSYVGDLTPKDFAVLREQSAGHKAVLVLFHDTPEKRLVLQGQFPHLEVIYSNGFQDGSRLTVYLVK